ncbi:hypothetical protein UY3_04908 [Chelonia mydas]|uniref:Uncharacterized protein n=1 Tax=Chelonia mydas TaxID=8469 RepID=M7C0H5_CHEMY|nr:hypothetical protein UY3_04908 [Chelonia mydas]
MVIEKKVLEAFLKSQHRPSFITKGLQMSTTNNLWKVQGHFLKAWWKVFPAELKMSLSELAELDLTCPASINDSYQTFCKLVQAAAKKSTPRSYYQQYIPQWSEAIKLDQELKSAGNEQKAINKTNELIQLLDQIRSN